MTAIGIFLYYVFVTVLVLTIVVFVHEMGHYLFARLFGVKVEAFSIGFGKEIFGRTDRRGMRWRICRFPVGGYVALAGETAPYPDYRQQFEDCHARGELWTRKSWQRILIAVGGPLANFVFAALVLTVMYVTVGQREGYSNVSVVQTGLGADRAGIQVGDIIRTVNGISYPDEWNKNPDLIRQDEDRILDVVVERDGKLIHHAVDLSPLKYDDIFGDETSRPIMGVILGRGLWKLSSVHQVDGTDTNGDEALARRLLLDRLGKEIVISFGDKEEGDRDIHDYRIILQPESNYGLKDPHHVNYDSLVYGAFSDAVYTPMAFGPAFAKSLGFCLYTIRVTYGFLYQVAAGKKDSGDFGGVLKIGEISGGSIRKSSDFGYDMIFKLFAVLSINIGFLNLIPFPMLDGGQIVLTAVEAFRKKPTSAKIKAYIMISSFGILIGFMILVNLRDLMEILGVS